MTSATSFPALFSLIPRFKSTWLFPALGTSFDWRTTFLTFAVIGQNDFVGFSLRDIRSLKIQIIIKGTPLVNVTNSVNLLVVKRESLLLLIIIFRPFPIYLISYLHWKKKHLKQKLDVCYWLTGSSKSCLAPMIHSQHDTAVDMVRSVKRSAGHQHTLWSSSRSTTDTGLNE